MSPPALQNMCQPINGIHRHQPQFHIIGPPQPGASGTAWPGGLNDINAVFQYRGLFHVMHQCDGGPAGAPCGGGHTGPATKKGESWFHSWGHAVSEDLVHWTRLPDVLVPPPYGTPGDYELGEDCDGTVSFTSQGPVIMFGPNCAPPRLNDAAIVAVARPANASDPFLRDWIKDARNPIEFAGRPCSFPGAVWDAADGSHWNMICAVGERSWGRYQTNDSTLHGPWSLADAAFASYPNASAGIGASSGAAFLPLFNATTGEPTHVIAEGANAAFHYGTYDSRAEKLSLSGSRYPMDHNSGRFAWAAAGLGEGGRILVAAWLHATDADAATERAAGCPHIVGIEICGVQAVSTLRVLRYESASRMLAAAPADEYAALRNATLFHEAELRLLPSEARTLPLGPGGSGAAADLELELDLSVAAAAALQLSVLSDASGTYGTHISIEVSPPDLHDGSRNASVRIRTTTQALPTPPPAAPFVVPVLAGETALAVRVLIDRSIVEAFFAGGRAAFTERAYPHANQTAMRLAAPQSGPGVTVRRLDVFGMGCGWV